jgi:hypothetical protein
LWYIDRQQRFLENTLYVTYFTYKTEEPEIIPAGEENLFSDTKGAKMEKFLLSNSPVSRALKGPGRRDFFF